MLREPPLSSDLEFKAMCYHEAGHAVACYLYKIPMKAISVVPTDEFIGFVSTNIVSAGERLEDWRERRSRGLAERIIRTCVAGEIAQKKHSRQTFRRYHSRHDWDYAVNIADKFSGSLKEAMAWCHYLYLNTESELLRDPYWKAIKALAKELKAKRVMKGTDARRTIDNSIIVRL